MQLSPASCYFIPSPNILLSTAFSNALILCSSPTIYTPIHKTGTIIIFYIVIFTSLDRRQKDKNGREKTVNAV
jgi:hypothetical protein